MLGFSPVPRGRIRHPPALRRLRVKSHDPQRISSASQNPDPSHIEGIRHPASFNRAGVHSGAARKDSPPADALSPGVTGENSPLYTNQSAKMKTDRVLVKYFFAGTTWLRHTNASSPSSPGAPCAPQRGELAEAKVMSSVRFWCRMIPCAELEGRSVRIVNGLRARWRRGFWASHD